MDGGILSLIILNFKAESQHWAVGLIDLLEPSWFIFVRFAFVLLIITAWFEKQRGLAILCVGVLWLGFTHTLFLRGFEWADSLSHGVRNVSYHLGVPAYDPSAIVQLGAYVAKPLFSATANQGSLGFIRSMWAGGSFMLAGVAMFGAFAVLAFVQFALLVMNYLLIGASPFFLIWMAVPGLNALSLLWIRLMTGCLAALFVTGLIALIMQNSGQWMADRYQAVFADAASAGTTLTWSDWSGPLGTAMIFAISFGWVPLRFFREGAGVAGELWSSVGVGMGLVGSALMSATGQSSGGGGGNTNTIPSPSPSLATPSGGGGGNSGGSMGPAQNPSSSQWGGGGFGGKTATARTT